MSKVSGNEPQAEQEEQDEAWEEGEVAEELELDEDSSAASVALAPASGDAASVYDPMQAYMRDVQRYPLLNPAEEQRLAKLYYEDGDLDAARKLVTSNLRLVVKIAYDYRRAYRNLLDLVQEGNIGLMQAVQKYDPYKGVKLSSYAAWWIRAYILRFILNNWRLVKLGTTQAQRKLFFNLQKEKARLATMGIEATPKAIAESLDVDEREVISMESRLGSGELSLDAPVGQSEGRTVTRLELLPGGGAEVDETLAQREIDDLLQDKIRDFAKTLKGKEALIFERRLLAEEPLTLQELGSEFGGCVRSRSVFCRSCATISATSWEKGCSKLERGGAPLGGRDADRQLGRHHAACAAGAARMRPHLGGRHAPHA